LPNNKTQQSSSTVEKEVIIIPLLNIDEINKNIKLLTEQIQQINRQVAKITQLSSSRTKKYK